jgi:4-hydroxy-4-methyl-2-oxoglutarate aldolase
MLVMPTSQTERLIAFDTGTLYEAAGEGAFAPGLLAMGGQGRVAGPALTVACPAGDNLAIHLAIAQAREGEVLVAQTHDWSYGVWGEVLTIAAIARGIRALVIDGSVRDLDAIRELGFPVYARGTALAGTRKREPGTVRAPVSCCGRLVQPGDLIVADVSGLVAIRPERVEEVLAAAAARHDKEAGMLRQLREGRTTIELLGLNGGPEPPGPRS